jgi:translocation and assembly module TamA
MRCVFRFIAMLAGAAPLLSGAALAAVLPAAVLPAAGGPGAVLAAESPPPGSKQETQPAQEAEPALPYRVDLAGVDDTALADLLRAASSLFELQDNPPPSLSGLERRIDADRDRLIAVLRSAGHYDSTLDVAMDREAQPLRVTLTVTPGPVYHLKDVSVRAAGDAGVPGEPVTAAVLGLEMGETARAPRVVEAGERLLRLMGQRGYAFARLVDRTVVVDHGDRTMDVAFVVDPGPLVRFGEARIEGVRDVDAALVRGRLPWAPGTVYDPALMERARNGIAQLEVFDLVRLQLADAPGPRGETPVTVTVSERKRHFLGAGVTYSSTEGVGGQAYWGHRNLFGGAEQLRVGMEFGRINAATATTFERLGHSDLRFNASFRKPDVLAVRQALVLGFQVVNEAPPAYLRRAVVLSAQLERRIADGPVLTYGIIGERGRDAVEEATFQTRMIGAPVALTWDGTDNVLNPTRGFRAAGTVTPWVPLAGDQGQRRFLASSFNGSAYYSVAGNGRLVAAGRVGAGSIVGAGLGAVAPDKRFYAGGGGSVRGYAFQKAGPRNEAGDPTGGRSLLETGLELRIKVTDEIGIVPFIDAGTVFASSLPGFSRPLAVGTGLGGRYYTEFGPLRVDVGVPLNRQSGDAPWQLYLSLGQAF